MPLVSFLERKKINKVTIVNYGCFAMAISMFLLLFNFWVGVLILMTLFMTLGEMLSFPFSNSFAISRAPKGHEGRYMAIFTMSFSMAHILSAKVGLTFIDSFGYQINWLFMGILGLVGVAMGYKVKKMVAAENLAVAKPIQ
jgi:MFS family permease